LAETALEAIGLWFWYEDESAPALQGVDLSVPAGQLVAIVGANGSGKTTLAKQVNGLLRPKRGTVHVAGRAVAHLTVGELARHVGFLFQHPEHQIFGRTVYQEVAFGPRNLGLSPAEVQARVDAALARFDLTATAERPPAILSYGLRRSVTLASLAAMDPHLLVLDEPTVGLDAPGQIETLGWLAEMHDRGRTILLVTHDMTLAAECAERVVVLHQGQIIADGPPIHIFQQPDLLSQASLVPPPMLVLAQALRSHGMQGDSLTVKSFCDEYAALANRP